MSRSLSESGMEPGPCSKPKQDDCKSIRDQMVTIRPPSSGADVVVSVISLVQSAPDQTQVIVDLVAALARPPGLNLHPLSKGSFVFSHQVLRI